MSYLIDTNVISEIRKRDRCNPNVAAWFASTDSTELYLSVLVLGEIRKGLERISAARPRDALALERWLADIEATFGSRILAIDTAVAYEWGRMSAKRPVSTVDALLAATANVHALTLVTRNVDEIADLARSHLNPFEASPG